MDRIRIEGGYKLYGSIPIGGAKNAALPLMTASLLSDQTLTLFNLPDLSDIRSMGRLLAEHGVELRQHPDCKATGKGLSLNAARVGNFVASYDLVRRMRASILVLGPLVARFGQAEVSLPGGCAIGTRPVDLHIRGLEALGATICLEGGYIKARAPKGLCGARIAFPFVSVGATENLMMAATLAEGTTILENAAREPEITDLARCLASMGAKISGAGTPQIIIQGVDRLEATEHNVMPDRIEAGSFAIAAAMTGGDILLEGARQNDIESVLQKLRNAGVRSEACADGLRVCRAGSDLTCVDVATGPYPEFPTDLQAQMMALMSIARGTATITETIFENRFMHVPELARMGADVEVTGATARIRGVPRLNGTQVMATDLRASFSLVLAGLVADGETWIRRVYHLDRGYERIEEKLAACGAMMERVRDMD